MYRNILVPLDGSQTAAGGLAEAIELARGQPSTLHLVHVLMDFPLMVEMAGAADYERSRQILLQQAEQILGAARQQVQAAGLECQTRVLEAGGRRVADVIVEAAEADHCGLIAMGTHGRRGFSRAALGSDAELVARLATMPVLLVRQPAKT